MNSTGQMEFLNVQAPFEGMPKTRYQGSKRKLLPWLYEILKQLRFASALDLFGGTGAVSHLFRFMGKQVHYNDILPSNATIARALFANRPIELTELELRELFKKDPSRTYVSKLAQHYHRVYFTDEENEELDILAQNISVLVSDVKRCEAYYCLFQAALSKRPYNLFHRANLEMRTRDVKRGFGNKATWDKSFFEHMRRFYGELGEYRERRASHPTSVTNMDAFLIEKKIDLVYIDTPYAKSEGPQESNYFNFYHFLDALCEYDTIESRMLDRYAHKPIYEPNRSWYPAVSILDAFKLLIDKFDDAVVVISYRSDGYPEPSEILRLFQARGRSANLYRSGDYRYVLASRSTDSEEILIVSNR